MIITKMALPRRTFLRGVGRDAGAAAAGCDGSGALGAGQDGRAGRAAHRLHLHPERRHPGAVDAGGARRGVRAVADPAARSQPFRDQMLVRERPGAPPGRVVRRRQCGPSSSDRRLAERRPCLDADHRPGDQAEHDGRSDRCSDDRQADTRLPSLELALESPTSIACDSGADCFYSNTVSWRTPTTPLPAEVHPRVVFERLFGDGGTAAQRRAADAEDGKHSRFGDRRCRSACSSAWDRRTARKRHRISRLGARHRARIQNAESAQRSRRSTLPERPTDIPATSTNTRKLMFELQALAFQADITRVFTLLVGREQTNRTYPEIGVPDGHHVVSHHQHDPSWSPRRRRSTPITWRSCADFLEKLRATPDGDGSLLDHSMLLYGSGLGDGDLHSHHDLPVAGRRRRRGPAEGRPASQAARNADDEPARHPAGQGGRADRAARRQHRPAQSRAGFGRLALRSLLPAGSHRAKELTHVGDE